MFPRARFGLGSWSRWRRGFTARPRRQRLGRFRGAQSLQLAAVVGLCLSSQAAPPRPGLGPGYGFFEDPSRRQTQVESDYRGTWHAFKTTAQDLMESFGANSEAVPMLVQIQTNAAFLDTKWTGWFNTHRGTSSYALRDDYLVGLHANVRVLRSLKKQKNTPANLAVLRDVAMDLQTKADNCRHSTDGLGKEIKVRVHTKAGGKEIGGFEVYFVPKGLLDVKSAHDRFPRESSPTDEAILNPGRYAMWARRKGFTGEPVTLTVGGHGELRTEVDLEVTAD